MVFEFESASGCLPLPCVLGVYTCSVLLVSGP
jgi:hypothetical protein